MEDEYGLRRARVRPAASYPDHPIMRFQHVSRSGDLKTRIFIRHDHRRLEFSQKLIRAPRLGELDARARQLSGMLLQFRLQPFEERERVRGGASEPTDDARLNHAHFLHVRFHDFAPHRHLPVRHDDGLSSLANAEHGRRVVRAGGERTREGDGRRGGGLGERARERATRRGRRESTRGGRHDARPRVRDAASEAPGRLRRDARAMDASDARRAHEGRETRTHKNVRNLSSIEQTTQQKQTRKDERASTRRDPSLARAISRPPLTFSIAPWACRKSSNPRSLRRVRGQRSSPVPRADALWKGMAWKLDAGFYNRKNFSSYHIENENKLYFNTTNVPYTAWATSFERTFPYFYWIMIYSQRKLSGVPAGRLTNTSGSLGLVLLNLFPLTLSVLIALSLVFLELKALELIFLVRRNSLYLFF